MSRAWCGCTLVSRLTRKVCPIVISIKMADQSNSKRRTGNVCNTAMKEPLQASDLAILQQERLFQILELSVEACLQPIDVIIPLKNTSCKWLNGHFSAKVSGRKKANGQN